MDCVVSLIILISVILLIMTIGVICANLDNFSNFTNITGYQNWENQLQDMKKNFDIGKQSGVLKYIPDQKSCITASNLLVQHNVAFKPTKLNDGCSYVSLRYAA
jgi:hypothetical protein